MNNRLLIESLTRHLNENCPCAEVAVRTLLSEEQSAAAHYLKAAKKMEKKAEEKGDDKLFKVAKVFKDIADEEKVHIGELTKLLDFLGVSDEQEEDGEEEAEEMLDDEEDEEDDEDE